MSGFAASYTLINLEQFIEKLDKRLRELGVVYGDREKVLRENPWLEKYAWKLLDLNDEYVRKAREVAKHGFVLYVPPKVSIDASLLGCFVLNKAGISQTVHNMIILDEGAELTFITTCGATAEKISHVGPTEIYVGKGAKLKYVMMHLWREDSFVRPRTAVKVEEGGEVLFVYANLGLVGDIQSTPKFYMYRNSRAHIVSAAIGRGRSRLDLGIEVHLLEDGASVEVISRFVAYDSAYMVSRASLRSHSSKTKGHVECSVLLLSDNAKVITIPELHSYKGSPNLTHEAAIGRVAEEQLMYLMARGFSEEEAISLITRGFLTSGLEFLPKDVRERLVLLAAIGAKGAAKVL